MRLSALILPLLALTLVPLSFVHAEESKVCKVAVTDDRELMAALPRRLRTVVESADFKRLMLQDEKSWTRFSSAMKRAEKNEGEWFDVKLGATKIETQIKELDSGGLRISIGKVDGDHLLKTDDLLKVLAGELAWVAERRTLGELTEVEIVARDLRSTDLIDWLEAKGFHKGRNAGKVCLTAGLAGAAVGGTGGYAYFYFNEKEVENGSPFDEQDRFEQAVTVTPVAAALLTAGLFCMNRVGFHYVLHFEPELSASAKAAAKKAAKAGAKKAKDAPKDPPFFIPVR